MKHQLKRLIENVLAACAPVFWKLRKRPGLVVLMYHRVLPANHPDRASEQPGMYVSPESLDLHIRVMRECGFTLMHLDEWLASARKGEPLPRLACAITFDDGWRDNYVHAYPVLKSQQAPATIFLVSELVGTRSGFWPTAVARLLSRSGASTDEIESAIARYKQAHTDREMQQLVADYPAEGDSRDLLDWTEVEDMARDGLIRIGSHTKWHTRLSLLSSEEAIEDELRGSRETLQRALGHPPTLFCYPNGDVTEAAAVVASREYKAAVTTERGWHTPDKDSYRIARIGVHEDIGARRASFIARVSGLL